MSNMKSTGQADLRAMLIMAEGNIRAAMAALQHGLSCLEEAIEATVQDGLEGLPSPTAPVSDHRRAHRPGLPPKIAGDPELQAFIAARVDRMTFAAVAAAVAAEVAAHFPPVRRIGRSAIYDWWRKAKAARS